MRNHARQFFDLGWCQFDTDPRLLAWVEAALEPAREARRHPEQQQWLRYQGTWFAGVNALDNDADASVGDSGPLTGEAVDFVASELGLSGFAWDRAQISICYPGYPLPMDGESEARARYRRDRDAAHVDGLLREGPAMRRHLREHHAFILGIPMVDFDRAASPFVIWEGSHEIMRARFADRLRDLPAEDWGELDITDTYQSAREQVFEECRRVEIHCRPGEAFLAHRLSLHGTAPWAEQAAAGPDGRMICYFRPPAIGAAEWLSNP